VVLPFSREWLFTSFLYYLTFSVGCQGFLQSFIRENGIVGGKCERCGRPAETLVGEIEIVGDQCEKHAPSAELFETIAVKSVLNVKSADTLQQGSAVVIEKHN